MKNNIYYERPKHLQNRPNTGKRNVNCRVNSTVRNNENTYDEGYMSMDEQEQQYYQPSYQAPVYEQDANQEVAKKNVVKEWIANGALIVLSITLVITITVLIGEVRFMKAVYTHDADDFWYAIEYENYANTVNMKWDNEAKGVYEDRELKQCYAVADYFEAASLYKAAVYTKNTEDMQEYLSVMKESYALLDDISYVAEEINTKLGIEMSWE